MTDWIRWEGGKCPVDPDTPLETIDREGLASRGRASFWRKEQWEHTGEKDDHILGYRIIGAKTDEKPDETSPNAHYRQGEIECIDAIRAALTDEEWRGFCKGNILKYVWRERHKGGDVTLIKAQDYLRWAIAGKAEGKR